MSSTFAPAPTPSTGGGPLGNVWEAPNRGIYTYSFLGGMAFICLIVLIFVVRAYSRRRRFAIRVQHALDSGRLDPAIVNEIRSLPSGALYFSRSGKKKKQKVKPLMHETHLGEPETESFASADGPMGRKESIDWRGVTPVAVSKFVSRIPEEPTPMTDPNTGRTLRPFHFVTSPQPTPPSQSEQPTTSADPSSQSNPPTAATSPEAPLVSPSDSLALSVFIAMPSPSSRLTRAKLDGEDLLPDICFGVTRVEVTQ